MMGARSSASSWLMRLAATASDGRARGLIRSPGARASPGCRPPHECRHYGLKAFYAAYRSLIPRYDGTKAEAMNQARALLLPALGSPGCAAGPLAIDDPQDLRKIEGDRFSFGEVVVGPPFAAADN